MPESMVQDTKAALEAFAKGVQQAATREAFDALLDDWTTRGFPEAETYRGGFARRGEIIAEAMKTMRALDGDAGAMAEAERDRLPVFEAAKRIVQIDEYDRTSDPTPSAQVHDKSADEAESETGIWSPKGMVDDRLVFHASGPIRVTAAGTALGVDAIRFKVGWHPLDTDGRRMAVAQSDDYRAPEYGGHVLLVPGIHDKPRQWVIEPPYANAGGFEVTVTVPPQPSYHGNSAGILLSVEAME